MRSCFGKLKRAAKRAIVATNGLAFCLFEVLFGIVTLIAMAGLIFVDPHPRSQLSEITVSGDGSIRVNDRIE